MEIIIIKIKPIECIKYKFGEEESKEFWKSRDYETIGSFEKRVNQSTRICWKRLKYRGFSAKKIRSKMHSC